MERTPKHRPRIISAVSVIFVAVIILFGFYTSSYIFSDRPMAERGIANTQKIAESTRVFFQKYLNYEKPQDIESVDKFARETFREDFIQSGMTNNQYYIDIIRENHLATGGISNTTLTFIMCIRLSGSINSNASIQDIPCEKRDNAQRNNNEIPAKLTDRPSLLYVPYHKLFYPKADL